MAPVGLRTVWAQWRKKPQEKSWVFSFGCWWVFMVEQLRKKMRAWCLFVLLCVNEV